MIFDCRIYSKYIRNPYLLTTIYFSQWLFLLFTLSIIKMRNRIFFYSKRFMILFFSIKSQASCEVNQLSEQKGFVLAKNVHHLVEEFCKILTQNRYVKKSFYVLKILQKWNWNTIEFILHSSEILDEMFQKKASKFAIFYV